LSLQVLNHHTDGTRIESITKEPVVGITVTWNAGAQRMFGYTENEAAAHQEDDVAYASCFSCHWTKFSGRVGGISGPEAGGFAAGYHG
jgi:hypothetical protein